jgi:hypothetical protein
LTCLLRVASSLHSESDLVCCAEHDTQQPTTQAALVSTIQQT